MCLSEQTVATVVSDDKSAEKNNVAKVFQKHDAQSSGFLDRDVFMGLAQQVAPDAPWAQVLDLSGALCDGRVDYCAILEWLWSSDVAMPSSGSDHGIQPKSSSKRANLTDALASLHDVLRQRWISLEALFANVDKNESGCIDKSELEDWFRDIGLGNWWDQFGEELWVTFDSNGSGTILKEEFLKGLDRAAAAETERMRQAVLAEGGSQVVPVDENTRFVSLVAHNNMKPALMKFVFDNLSFFKHCPIVTTGSTGTALERMGLHVTKKVQSGPLGGDQEVGAMAASGKIAAVFFFKDPLSPQPHSADIEALVRLCDVWMVPYASNPGSARGILMMLERLGLGWQEGQTVDSVVSKYQEDQKKVLNALAKAKP